MFNQNSKEKNIVLSSGFGVFEQIVVYFTMFVFRTVFLSVLSKEYLGLTGLFSNILQIFSLAELGIGSVIVYRMYAPVKARDEDECAKLLAFYKCVYIIIAVIVFLLGVAFSPFITFTIADTGEIPSDVNLTVIYWLFVVQNVVSYLCVYRQALLIADQKNYVLSLFNSIYHVVSNVLQIIVLIFTKNYTIVLVAGISANLLYNIIFSMYIKNKYKSIVTRKTEKLSCEKRIQIFKDTGAVMCHKIGYVAINGTDSIILSKFVGIAVLGLYSNYQMISMAIDVMLNKLLGSFVSTIGNLSVDATPEQKYDVYKKLFFVNMWLASFCAVCYFVLINPFIQVWLGFDFLLDTSVSLVISLYIFFNSSRIINSVFTLATGIFVKDKLRPLVQAVLNLVFSVILVKKMGMIGVFIGSLISIMLTVWWREGILLYRNVFKKTVAKYYGYYALWTVLSVAAGALFYFVCNNFSNTFWGVTAKFVICVFGVNFFFFILFSRTDNFVFYKEFIRTKIRRRKTE